MDFLIENCELVENYNTTWDKVNAVMTKRIQQRICL